MFYSAISEVSSYHTMTRRIICSLLFFHLTLNHSYCQNYLFGQKNLRTIHAIMLDTLIYVEKMEKFKGAPFMDFDTLKLDKETFKGEHYKVKIKGDNLLFFPGKIPLVKQLPNDTFFKRRNWAYINSNYNEIRKEIDWSYVSPHKLMESLKNDSTLIETNPNFSYGLIDTILRYSIDTLLNNSWQNIDSMIVFKDRTFMKKKRILTTKDPQEISYIWSVLRNNDSIKEVNTQLNMSLQFFPIYILYGVIHPVLFLIPFPAMITYGILAVTENFMYDRIRANKTYVIKMYSNNNSQTLKIRDNSILSQGDYKYFLHDSFETILK
jgi:hypothetical protein